MRVKREDVKYETSKFLLGPLSKMTCFTFSRFTFQSEGVR